MVPPFVDAAWLAEHPQAVVADVRSYLDARSERAAYDEGHLPGARFVDLAAWLAAPPSPQDGRHPLPDPAVFAAGLGQAGIGDDVVVVAYDDAGGVFAARLVWMLRVTGRSAALLDGGLLGWDGPLSREEPAVEPVQVAPRPWPASLLVDLPTATDGRRVLLDARPRERFRGDVDPVDVRAGHVPGAVNLPARENVDARGRLLPDDVLRARLAGAGVVEGADVVSSCGSGVTACHTLLVMEHLGLPPGRLWPGSWSQYAATDLPLATGP